MMQRDPLSPRQAACYAAIVDMTLRDGYAPTLREVGHALSVTKVTICEHRSVLIKRGYLATSGRGSRNTIIIYPIDPRYVESSAKGLQLNAVRLLSYVQDAATRGCVEAQALVEQISHVGGDA